MSEDKTTQTATDDADAKAKPGSEGSGAPEDKSDDFEQALSEFGEDDAKPSSDQQKPQKPDDPDLKAEVQALRLEQNQRVYREDLGKVINKVRGDFAPDEVDDEFIDTWINAQAKKDSRVAQAWIHRHDDPAKFARVVKGLTQKFAEKHGKLRNADQDATGNREAVADAVRRGSSRAPEGKAPDYSKMTDQEFREAVKKDHGFSPL